MPELDKKDYSLDAHGKHFHRGIMFVMILIGTFAGMLGQTFLSTAYPTLMDKFNISLSTAQGATTWYLLANGIMVPVSAYLTTKIPTRWLFMIAYGFTAIGTGIAMSAPTSNYNIFLLGRVVMAMGAGISLPLMMTVITNIFPPDKIGVPMGMGGLVIGLAPAIGPTYGGAILSGHSKFLGILQLGDWRTMFTVPFVILVIVTILTPILMADVLPNRDMKLDILSLLESLAGFGLFLFGFTNVGNDGWGDFKNVILPIIVGLIIIAFFIFRQLHLKDPFLDLSVFKVRQFTVATIAAAINTMAMMGVEMMLPTYIQNVHGLTALQSGLLLLPGSIMMALMSPIAGQIYDKFGARKLTLIGFILLSIGTLPYMFLTANTPEAFITITYWVRFVAIGLIMMPLITSGMNALPRDKAAQGSASNNTARMIASSVVVAILASVTTNVINASKPASHLQTTNPLQYAEKMINASLNGFHVSFGIAFGFSVLGIFVALFLHKGKAGPQPVRERNEAKAKQEAAQGGDAA
ncbi:MAG: multidrug efflux MFS transporter [Streptococcaceae bacterium]|jgi:EmrB/QacA subfamily drug resistance transporter|nr:multidrug efflux MFS transporter [Streptococcaceae bacterium]